MRWVLALVLTLVATNVSAFDKNHLKKFIALNSCVKCDLNGVNLSKADLSGVVLYGANLNKANLIETNLRGANLSGAGLSTIGANLTGADLSTANLNNAILDGTILQKNQDAVGGREYWLQIGTKISIR